MIVSVRQGRVLQMDPATRTMNVWDTERRTWEAKVFHASSLVGAWLAPDGLIGVHGHQDPVAIAYHPVDGEWVPRWTFGMGGATFHGIGSVDRATVHMLEVPPAGAMSSICFVRSFDGGLIATVRGRGAWLEDGRGVVSLRREVRGFVLDEGKIAFTWKCPGGGITSTDDAACGSRVFASLGPDLVAQSLESGEVLWRREGEMEPRVVSWDASRRCFCVSYASRYEEVAEDGALLDSVRWSGRPATFTGVRGQFMRGRTIVDRDGRVVGEVPVLRDE